MATSNFNEIEPEAMDYRPISGLSITAFVLSLLSFVSLTNPVLVCIGLFGLIFSIFVLIRIRTSEREYIGVNFAWLAIAVCCFTASLTLANYFLFDYARWSTARQYADQWLEKIQKGEKETVHQLTLAVNERLPEGRDQVAYYSDGRPRTDILGDRQPNTEFASYWDVWYPHKLILADGDKGRIEYKGRAGPVEKLTNANIYHLKYVYHPAEPNEGFVVAGTNKMRVEFPIEFEIKMKRTVSPPPVGTHWEVFIVRIEGALQRHAGRRIE